MRMPTLACTAALLLGAVVCPLAAPALAAAEDFSQTPTPTPIDDMLDASRPMPSRRPAPFFAQGFATLKDQLGDLMGEPLELERPSTDGGADAIQLTSTGLAVHKRGEPPAFTDGHQTWKLLPPSQTMAGVSSAGGAGALPPSAPSVSAAILARVACIESKESGGANVANARGSGAGGVMQYMDSTFAAHAREMGHPEWSKWNPAQARAVAAHDLALGRRGQWTVSGC